MEYMKSRLFILFASLLFVMLKSAESEVFRFKFVEGDSYRINSLVNEDVYLDGALSHTAYITNRISVSVSDVRNEGGRVSARHDCTFMTSERNDNRRYPWSQQYESIFRRTEDGRYNIAPKYFMPVVRDVPVFPEANIKPGDRWQATGEEAHDFRPVFGLQMPYKVPFTADYVYTGPVRALQKNGKEKILHHIQVEYTMFFNTPQELRRQARGSSIYPVSVKGFSRQQLYWDAEKGFLSHYNEEFRIQLELNTGNVLEYRGTASAEVTENVTLDRERIIREMNEAISRQNIENARVSASDEGITITLENIRFVADSSRLLPGEEKKVRQIAGIIAKYPNNDLLITGHTALAGTASARQKLSEERAEAVAAMFISLGVRKEQNVFTQGLGAERPIAPNDTEENKARNRRVEITILER